MMRCQKLIIYRRVRTEYFDHSEWEYQYQEMGAMRIPVSEKVDFGNETTTLNWTNHQLVFQLADALNDLNRDNSSFHIDWIPFIEYSDNALSFIGDRRKPDGSIPTVEDVANNKSLGTTYDDPLVEQVIQKLESIYYDPQMVTLMAKNIFKAHKAFLGMCER